MRYFCCDDLRRQRLLAPQPLNGIDFVEVVDREFLGTPQEGLRQTQIRVFFVRPPDNQLLVRLGPFAAPAFSGFVRITGGESVLEIREVSIQTIAGGGILIQLDRRGDFSRYTLALAEPDGSPLAGLDPALSIVEFSFKVECPSPLDCAPQCDCPTEQLDTPIIDYLARDFTGFRQLFLDRLSVIAPGWHERNLADLGITLVELLAYVGDYLGYRLDAISTEAYLGTARHRVSIRRHARLLDYSMSDGANARAWIHVRLHRFDNAGNPAPGGLLLPRQVIRPPGAPNWIEDELPNPVPPPPPGGPAITQWAVLRFATRAAEGALRLDEADLLRRADRGEIQVFEALQTIRLWADHNEMEFYTWLGARCCLPRNATRATLRGHFPNLAVGEVLIFVERIGPRTGNPRDADPNRRHAVRLTLVSAATEVPVGPPAPLTDPVTGELITEIGWSAADALPFPFTISSESNSLPVNNVSVALGNILLAEHGCTLPNLPIEPAVPRENPALAPVSSRGGCACETPERPQSSPRFYPVVPTRHPIAQIAPPPDLTLPATRAFDRDPEDILPAVVLADNRGRRWSAQRDLLSSAAASPDFVGELGDDNRLWIRFGDDRNGERPAADTSFTARIRVGASSRGRIGSEAIAHFAFGALAPAIPLAAFPWIEAVSNPMSARGAMEPEAPERVRQLAPYAFRQQLRAVTPDDYARFAERHSSVQRAAATLRWTGSWHTIFLAVDRKDGLPVDLDFEDDLLAFLEPFRMAGHDIEISGPSMVPLQLTLRACVDSNTFRSDVLAALRDIFSSGRRPDGSLGFFHPDQFTFGQSVILSRIYAAAQNVPGLRHIEVIALHRYGAPDDTALQTGELRAQRLEIPRLDSNPNFPERGELAIQLTGGR